MQQANGSESLEIARTKWSSSLVLQDLRCQLSSLDASINELPQSAAVLRENSFTRIDTNSYWAIQYSNDSYHDGPEER